MSRDKREEKRKKSIKRWKYVEKEILPKVVIFFKSIGIVLGGFFYRLLYQCKTQPNFFLVVPLSQIIILIVWKIAIWFFPTIDFKILFWMYWFVLSYMGVWAWYELTSYTVILSIQETIDVQAIGTKKKYHNIPLELGKSWNRVAEILGVEIDFHNTEFDQKQNILKIKIVDVQKIKIIIPLGSTKDELFSELCLIPAHNSLKKNVYVSAEGYLYQYIPALLSNESNSILEYITKIPELARKIKDLSLEKNTSYQVEWIIQEGISSPKIQKKAQQFLNQIRDNKKIWKFGMTNISGKERFLQIDCRLLDNQTVQNVEKIKEDIEAQFRCRVIIEENSDRGIFTLVILLDEELSAYEMNIYDLKKYNEIGEFFIGESLMGPLSTNWNFQANFFWIAGMSGAGKSVQIKNILLQLAQISQSGSGFDYATMFLTSSSKIADFIEFEKAGALISSGIESQLKVFEYVLDELERREKLFYEHQVENIKEYNELHPEEQIKQLVLLADEYENTRNSLDKKQSDYAEKLLLNILNIGRSSGCVVIIGTQSALKGAVGIVADKLTVKFSGYNESNVLRKFSPAIALYYQTLDKAPQGVFFYKALNLKSKQEFLTYDGAYVLIQTPYVSGINQKNLPKLFGGELKEKILKPLLLEDEL